MWGRERACGAGRRALGVLDSEVDGTGLSELLPWRRNGEIK